MGECMYECMCVYECGHASVFVCVDESVHLSVCTCACACECVCMYRIAEISLGYAPSGHCPLVFGFLFSPLLPWGMLIWLD